MNSNLPTLPKSLLNLIGEYGMARTDGVSPLEVQHRWELLIAGIKDYAASVATQPPQDERTAEPAQPVALSTLTEYQIWEKFLETLGPLERENVVDSIRRGRSVVHNAFKFALTASAPAQQATPVPEQNYAECWVCGKPMDGKSEDDCHCFHRKELATRQPVAAEVTRLRGLLSDALNFMENMDPDESFNPPTAHWAKALTTDLRAALSGTGSDESKKGEA